MYSVKVKEHMMIAHSLPDPFFGPAQNMHGATYVAEVTFMRKELNAQNVVIDIGEATVVTRKILGELNYQNLDELPQFKDILTTTEFLAYYIHTGIKKQLKEGIRLKVELFESHVASASYED